MQEDLLAEPAETNQSLQPEAVSPHSASPGLDFMTFDTNNIFMSIIHTAGVVWDFLFWQRKIINI